MDGRSPHFARELMSHRARLVNFARGRGRLSRDDAEDAAGQTIMKAWEARERFDGDNLIAWLFTILRNTLISKARRARIAPTYSTEDIEWLHPQAPDDPLQSVLLSETLRAMLKITPSHLDTLILLARGNTVGQVAEILNIPDGTIKSRAYRGRRELEALTA